MEQVDLPAWLEILQAAGLGFGPFLVFLSAIAAAYIAWRVYRQRKEADDRAEWWRRTQWAVDYASDQAEGKAGIGLEALGRLEGSALPTDEDRELMKAVLEEVIAARASRAYNRRIASVAEKTRPRRRLPWTRRGSEPTPMTRATGNRPESLTEAARELMTENPDGTYSVRIPSEGDRVVTVPEHGNARIIAKAEALRMKLSAR